MQPCAERLGDLSAGGGNDGDERGWHPIQRAFARNRSVVVQASLVHGFTMPRGLGGTIRSSASSGAFPATVVRSKPEALAKS